FGTVTHDGRYLVIDVRKGTKDENEIFIQRLDSPESEIQPLFTGFESNFTFIEAVEGRLFFETDQQAPR
ncbi:MAG: hypothetical protein GWN29_08560, partial [Gammaproteobacteria bacterium]|nr:hypothetical protein [Gammaproteobacteria bacterium]